MPLQLVKDLPSGDLKAKTCMFCNRADDNELQFGKFYTNESITAHYYCLLFSSGLEQKGKDEEGILGFLKHDILKENRRGNKLTCSKCRQHGATVGCCNKACKKTYHFPCGVESRMLNQYFGAFNSFCIKHQPVQNVVVKGHGQKATCTICHEEVIAHPNFDVLWAPCCKKQSWFHRICMQKLALSAGYFFKCPICSNNTLFCNEMKRCGIYVPEQDASWELEPNAFQELVQRHNKCDHPVCICPKGRTHDGEGTRWELLLCSSCGSKGIHIGCGRLDWSTMEWDCDDCSSLGTRRNSASIAGSSTASLSIVPSVTADALTTRPVDALTSHHVNALTSRPADILTPRPAVKRPRSDDFTSSSEESSDDDDEREVDVISVSDPESSATSFTSQTYSGASNSKPSRNVARRGRGGSWSSRAAARNSGNRQSCNFDNLRFKVTNDSKNIIVIIDNDQAVSKSYTIPVDQPTSPLQRRIRASNK